MKKQINKKGLFQKYILTRTDGKPIDPEDEYFVLKVKGKGNSVRIEACRRAVITYAMNISPFLPQLSTDLLNKYAHPVEWRGKFKNSKPSPPEPVKEERNCNTCRYVNSKFSEMEPCYTCTNKLSKWESALLDPIQEIDKVISGDR